MAIFRHVCSGVIPGEIWTFTMHTDSSLDVDAAESAWSNAIGAFFQDGTPAFTLSFAEELVVTQTSTALLSGATGAQVTRRITAQSIAGTSSETMLPPQLSVAVSLRTELATRAGRGRFYLPTMVPSVVTDGRVTPGNVSLIADKAQGLLQDLLSSTLTPVIYHRTSNTSTPITSIDVGDVWDTQRRRRGALIESREARPV